MAGKTDSSTEVPEGFTHVGLHMVTTNTDGSGHLHLASLYNLKLEKKNPNPVILLDRVTHFKGKKKKKSKNPLCPSKKRIYMCLNYVSFILLLLKSHYVKWDFFKWATPHYNYSLFRYLICKLLADPS